MFPWKSHDSRRACLKTGIAHFNQIWGNNIGCNAFDILIYFKCYRIGNLSNLAILSLHSNGIVWLTLFYNFFLIKRLDDLLITVGGVGLQRLMLIFSIDNIKFISSSTSCKFYNIPEEFY